MTAPSDLATFLFYTYGQPAARQRLLAALHAQCSSGVIGTYTAHIAVRQLDFSIRRHGSDAVGGWLEAIGLMGAGLGWPV